MSNEAIQTSYFLRQSQEENGVRSVESNKLPKTVKESLKQKAAGRFPVLEEALNNLNISIPKAWTVSRLLSAVAASVSDMVREDNGLSKDNPRGVQLIVSEDFAAETGKRIIPQGKKIALSGFSKLEFRVVYGDNINVDGEIRMPGYGMFHGVIGFWGIPYIAYLEGSTGSTHTHNDVGLFNPNSGNPTENGTRLLNKLANLMGNNVPKR